MSEPVGTVRSLDRGSSSRRSLIRGLLLGSVAAVPGILPGCSAILGARRQLFVLTPKTTFPPDLPRVRAQLLVEAPLTPGGLDINRIALSRSAVSLDYFADSEWTDRLPRMVQSALLESFEASRSVTAIDRESIGLRADYVLKTEIRHFEAVYDAADAPPQVWVRMNARLVKMPERVIVASTMAERREPALANDLPAVVLAFDAALGAVMKSLVIWTVTDPALSASRS